MAPGWSMTGLACLTLVHLTVLHHARRIMRLPHAETTHCAGMGKAGRQPGHQENQQDSGKFGPHRSTRYILQAVTITAADSPLQIQPANCSCHNASQFFPAQ
jgi:hypothetical protein